MGLWEIVFKFEDCKYVGHNHYLSNMNNNRYLFSFISALVILISCQQEEISQDVTAMRSESEFYGSMESFSQDTRTSVSSGNKIIWNEGDEIAIFEGCGIGRRYLLADDMESFYPFDEKEYVDESDFDANIAVYPYSESISCSEKNGCFLLDNIVLSAEQNYVSDSFDDDVFPMVAVTSDRDDRHLSFRNVCGGLKLKIKGNAVITSIILKGNDYESLAGTISVDAYADGKAPVMRMESNDSKEVVLVCNEGVQLNEEEAVTFIISLPPVKFKKGFQLRINDNEGYSMEMKTEKFNEVKRSSLLSMPEITYIPSGKAYPELLSLIKTRNNGDYSVQVTIPESMRNGTDHVIRYGHCCYPMYMYNKHAGNHDAELLVVNGGLYLKEDMLMEINEENMYRKDDNGNILYDSDGNVMVYYDPVAPGEPTVFFAGEFSWGKNPFGYYIGDSETGYYFPLYDFESYGSYDSYGKNEEEYWTGAYQKMFFTAGTPDVLDAEVEVEIEDLTPVSANIRITPDENIYGCCYAIMDQATYEHCLDLLQYKEEYMQWFVTSYFGYYYLRFGFIKEPSVLAAEDSFIDLLKSGQDYHILITALGNENGTSQKFIHKTFTTPAKEYDPPVVNVVAVDDNMHPYEAKFNIKAPGKDLIKAYYAANYVREWQLETNSGLTYADLCQNSFSQEEIAKINSDEGLTIFFSSRDGETLRMAVLGYNIENTPNQLYEGCSAIADCRTCYQIASDRVDTDLFNVLSGEWTAEARVTMQDGSNVAMKIKTADIAITDELDVPALTEEIYDIYESFGKDRATVDAYYSDFKIQTDLFNSNRLYSRNRLLCMGWFDEPMFPDMMKFKYPFDLFVDKDYNAVDCSMIFYDFGPKWFLEIAEDGSVCIPFDMNVMAPMSSVDREVYIAAYNQQASTAYLNAESGMPGEFPVSVSEDRNTIIIYPIYPEGDENALHYMNAFVNDPYSGYSVSEPIVSEIVLTRKNEVAKACSSSFGNSETIRKTVTDFSKLKKYNKVKTNVVTMEVLDKGFDDWMHGNVHHIR